MALTDSRSFRPRPEALRRGLRLFGYTALFCVLVAAVLTLALPRLGSFWRNLWFSECIGLWVSASGALMRQLPWVRRLPDGASLSLSVMAAVPMGYVLGYTTAYSLLGEPVHLAGLSHNRLAAIGATVLAGGFVTYLAWLRNRLSDEAAARSMAQQLAVEAELRMLRAQLEPHMLFNTLANLRSLVDDDPAHAKHMIDLLITYLRGALAGSRADTTTLRAEFTQLAAYLEIMTLRLGKRLSYQLELPDALEQARVPAMLLQPLVENAIKHGIEPKIGGGTLTVTAQRNGAVLALVVSDTGLGLPPDADSDSAATTTPKPGSSYGLAHVRDRLRALYGSQGTLTLERREPSGTRATVRIPA
ncbi:MAG: histidine kinase [Rhizobacter sp.]|nr:histidine kinase [Rhizobacter sp.]